MATIEDYASGRILTQAKEVLAILNASDQSLKNTPTGKILLEKLTPFEPKLLSYAQAVLAIQGAAHCAVGVRVCYRAVAQAQFTETVFLDELAEAMASAGKARMVTPEEAVATLEKYPDNRKILSKVSGKPMELCCSSPDTCIAWKMEKRGLTLIQHQD